MIKGSASFLLKKAPKISFFTYLLLTEIFLEGLKLEIQFFTMLLQARMERLRLLMPSSKGQPLQNL